MGITSSAVRLRIKLRPLVLFTVNVVFPVYALFGFETAIVAVTARYANCRYYHERELQTLAAATVETSALGVHATRTVPFDHPLVVPSPMIVECPDRTLVRDDDVRR